MTTLQPLPATATATTQTGSPALVTTGLPDLELRDPALAEAAAWSALGAAARARATRLEELCQSISAAGRKHTGLAVERCAHLAGVSPAQMQRLYNRWQKGGRMALVNRNKAKPLAVFATPAAFREWWCQRQLQARRDTGVKALWRALLRQLEAWEKGDDSQAVPGYQTPPARDRRTGVPPGWLYQTLARIKPTTYQKALALRGGKAASAYLPAVRSARVDIPALGCVLWDDEVSDFLTAVGGQKQATRPVAFHSLDLKTGLNVMRSYMPVIVGDDGGRKTLTQEYFYWFLAEFLCSHGYRVCDHGTVFVVEHGTAAIDEETEKRIADITGGKVRIDRSGIHSDPAVRGLLYPGPAAGNPRYKAGIEVFFRALREETGAQLLSWDGHTGRHRDLKPEELPGIERAHAWWTKLALSLPEEHRALLAPGIHPWQRFVSAAHRIIEGLNDRSDHHFQQWEACGFTGFESLTPGNLWMPLTDSQMSALPAAQLDLSVQMGFLRQRRLSPREAFEREMSQSRGMVRKLARRSLPLILPETMARVCKVTPRLEFQIEDWRVNGADPLFYIAECATADGLRIRLTRGESYQVWLNPFDPEHIQVCHASGSRRGALIGECVRTHHDRKTDNAALAKQCGIVGELAAAERVQVERAMHNRSVQRQTTQAWNKTVAEDFKNVRAGKPSRFASPDVQAAADAMDDLLDSRAELQPATADDTYDPLE